MKQKSSSHYRLATRWVVDGTIEEVGAIFSDTASLVHWYPATYLRAEVLDRGAPGTELGKLIRVKVKGWMPHTLTFMFKCVTSEPLMNFTLESSGDFEGRLICSWERAGNGRVVVNFDWEVHVTKPFVRFLSWLLKPVFVSNHLWVVARGEESLALEIRRRRAVAAGLEFREKPPGRTFPHGPLSTYFKSPIWSRASLVDLSTERATSGDTFATK